MGTLSDEAEREGSPLPRVQAPESNAEPRAYPRESVALSSLPALAPVTERARAAGAALARAAEYLDRPGSLVHARPPSLARAREFHQGAAARHGAPALRAARLLYGYLHLLLVKPSLNFLEWATETPLRLAVAVIIGLVVWYFG